VSRARDQLWIFHSFDPAQLSPDDARGVIFETLPTEPSSIDVQLEACDSQFERDVVTAIAAADASLIVKTQVEALGYSIDIVVEDRNGHRLAVECDGDRWHSSDSQIRSDLYRQRTLEAIGWRFHRFLASEWYDDPERHLQTILDELRRAMEAEAPRAATTGAGPGSRTSSSADEPTVASDEDPDPTSIEDDAPDDGPEWTTPDPFVGEDDADLVADSEDLALSSEEIDLLADVDALLPDDDADRWLADDDPDQIEPPWLSDHPEPVPTGLGSPGSWRSAAEPIEKLVCESCGQTWERPIRRGRKPSKCPTCATGRAPASNSSPTDVAIGVREVNRRLAAALRDHGKEPNGTAWMRAKDLLKAGNSFDEAARKA
jgi:very-short-patch-repair endonuclease